MSKHSHEKEMGVFFHPPSNFLQCKIVEEEVLNSNRNFKSQNFISQFKMHKLGPVIKLSTFGFNLLQDEWLFTL